MAFCENYCRGKHLRREENFFPYPAERIISAADNQRADHQRRGPSASRGGCHFCRLRLKLGGEVAQERRFVS